MSSWAGRRIGHERHAFGHAPGQVYVHVRMHAIGAALGTACDTPTINYYIHITAALHAAL